MLVGTIPAGGSGTIVLDYLPERLAINNAPANSQNPNFNFDDIGSISISQSGRQLVDLRGSQIKSAGQVGQLTDDGGGASWLALGLGRKNGSTTIQVTNDGINPARVYASSSGFSDLAYNYVGSSINPSANQTFQDFDLLVIENPTEIDRVNLVFENGFNDDFTELELRALSAQTENLTGGLSLGPNLLIHGAGVKRATIYNKSVASLLVNSRTLVRL